MKRTLKRIPIWIGKGLIWLVGSVVVLVVLVLVGLQTPWAQKRVAEIISEQANKALAGRVEVTLDGGLTLFGFSKLSARLLPADVNDDAPLAELDNLSASWDLPALVQSLLGSGPLVVGIHHVEAERAFVDLRNDPNGDLALVNATSVEPSTEPESDSSGPPPLIHLEELNLFDVRVLLPIAAADTTASQPETVVRQAATIDQIHARFDMHEVMSGTVTLSSLEAAIPGMPTTFSGDVGAAFYLNEDNVPLAQATLEGDLQGVPVTVDALYDDEQWVARVFADGSATAWKGAELGFEPASAVAVEVLAAGDLNAGTVTARVVADEGAEGAVATAIDVAFSPLVANGVLVVEGANPRSFALAAPAGDINVSANFNVQAEPERAEVHLALRDSSLEGNAIPDFDVDARAKGTAHAEVHLQATDDSGLRLHATVDNQGEQHNEVLTFALQGQAKRLPDYPNVPQLSALDVRDLALDANGAWRGATESLDAKVRLDVARVAIPSAQVSVAELSVHATTQGKLSAPSVEGSVSARAVRAGDIGVFNLQADATEVGRGQSTVSATARVRLAADAPLRELSARTTLTALSPFTAKDTGVILKEGQESLQVSVAALRTGDTISVDGIRTSGAVQLTGGFTTKGNSMKGNVEIVKVDLAALSKLLQPMVPPLTGSVSANLGLETNGSRLTSAHVFARGSNVGTPDTRLQEFGTSLVVKQDELSGTIHARRGQSFVRVDTQQIQLAKLRSNPATFGASDFRGQVIATVLAHSGDFSELEQIQGEVHMDGQVHSQLVVEQRDDMPLKVNALVKLVDVDLRQAEPRVPSDWLSGKEERLDETKPAIKDGQVRAEADTKGGASAADAAAWSITGLNAELTSAYDGGSGRLVNSVAANDHENPDAFAKVSLVTTVPMSKLNAEFVDWLPNAPLEASLVVPKTPLDALPGGSFVPTGIEASVQADVQIAGTVSSPRATGWLAIEDLQVSGNSSAFPISLTVDTKASKEAVDATFKVTHDDLLLVKGDVKGAPADNEWRVAAKIDEVPLGRLPFVRDYGVSGALSGDLTFDTGQGNPIVVAAIKAKDILAYGERIPAAVVDAKLANGEGNVVVHIKQTRGHVKLTAAANSPSGQLADYTPTKARIEARAFQIRPLMVAVPGKVTDLSGLLDGTVDVAFANGSTDATGQLSLNDGVVLVPALGKQIYDIEMRVQAAPGRVEISRLDAKVERGLLLGKGEVKYTPDGRLRAEVEVRLPDDRRLPIANKGRNVAEASGRIMLVAGSGPDRATKLSVDVPALDVYFSDSVTDTVMSSEKPAFVSMGTYLPDGHFVTFKPAKDHAKDKEAANARAAGAEPTIITVNLGKDVWLHHGTSTFAGIDGKVQASIGEDTRVTGAINLAEGRIDIQGRVFDVRPGTITFKGDSPPNPDVVAEAAWNAPSGHTIIAAYRGSISNGKVILRSEPALSYGEILNVLLFDDPEGASGGGEGSPGAGEVAATIASAGLSRSLTSLTDLDIQANIETDAAGSPRPELGVRLTPRLAVQVAYNLEPSAALSQPPDKAFVSFDWRLSNAWTVEATLGDHGSAATDLTWKYRY